MTIPLSRTRSRTSIRLVPPAARSTAIVKAPYSFLSVRSVPCATARRLGQRRQPAFHQSQLFTQLEVLLHHLLTAGRQMAVVSHQSRPMASALSIEQIMRRMRMVSSSTSASDTLISPPRRDLCPGRGRGHPPARRFHGSDWLSGRSACSRGNGPLITRGVQPRESCKTRANRRSIDRTTLILNGAGCIVQRGSNYGRARSVRRRLYSGRHMARYTVLLAAALARFPLRRQPRTISSGSRSKS